jgi:hypothetical protein
MKDEGKTASLSFILYPSASLFILSILSILFESALSLQAVGALNRECLVEDE